jgi:UDP-N-acetylmuramoyl-tripeptide--D-alanyl-D-alanine ligase
MIKEIYKQYLNHSSICTDTRKIERDCLFFALKGENFNGNEFAKQALEKGAAFVIIDEKEHYIEEKCFLVKDVLTTLQELANYHRSQLNIPVIGITGTNGKTSTKELLNVVLSKRYKTVATQGNFNNHIGVPLTLLSIQKNTEIAIIEMGANHIGDIEFLCKIAEPNYGIITNIGTAHIEGFGSKEGVVKAKNELYQFIKNINSKVFVNANDQLLTKLSSQIERITYGNKNADCNGQLISSSPFVKFDWKNNIITSKLYGIYNFDNILAAICIGEYFKVADDKIIEAIESYTSTNNRSEIRIINNNTYYLDAYNANPSSMNVAIDTFSENNASNKLMVLGDMLELGSISNEEHQNIVNKAKDLNIKAIFVGNEFNSVATKYDFDFVANNLEAKKMLDNQALNEHHILIKGSRGIKLEEIIKS